MEIPLCAYGYFSQSSLCHSTLRPLKAYQNGERSGPLAQMMQAQLQKLNDEDLRDIAAFYASQGD
ncbi:hypothetical protein KW484_07230 [Vibrio fluvialis]|nr:hypothetical protein [Vibrio fluvialis]